MKKLSIVHNFVGGFSNFAFLFITSFILLPYYFKFVSTTDYGIWLGGISFLSLASVLESNIGLILTQQLGEKWTTNKPLEFSKILTAALFFGLIVGVFIILFTYFFKETLIHYISHDKQIDETLTTSFLLYAISLSLTILSSYISSVTQVFLKTFLPPFINIFATIFGVLYTFWAIPTHGIIAIALGNLIKGTIFCLFISVYSFRILNERKIKLIFRFNYFSRLIKEIQLPIISKIGMTIAMGMQNFIVAASISASATTIFDITKKLPFMTQSVINILAASSFTAFSLMYSERKDDNKSPNYTIYYFLLMRIFLFLSLTGVYFLGQDFITLWVGFDKFGGNLLLALLCITALLDQLRLILSQQYYAIGKFNVTAITDTVFAVSFVIMAMILIPLFKLNGIVLAGIFANIVYFSSCFYLEKKNKIFMIPYIINQSFVTDFVIILIISASAKFVYEYYRGNIIIEILIVLIAFAILFAIYILKEKSLYHFLITILGKKQKPK